MGAVYTVKVKTRPRPAKTVTRRRLKGKALAAAKALAKYVDMAVAFDARKNAASDNVDVNELIFRNNAEMLAMASLVSEYVAEQMASVLKIVRNK